MLKPASVFGWAGAIAAQCLAWYVSISQIARLAGSAMNPSAKSSRVSLIVLCMGALLGCCAYAFVKAQRRPGRAVVLGVPAVVVWLFVALITGAAV
jgi:hypothetical protein